MEIKVKSYSSQSSLISAIIFFIFGAILFTNAEAVVSTLAFGIGLVLAVIAIIELIIYFINRKQGTNKIYDLGRGIIALAIAIIFIFASSLVEQIIRFIIGFWCIFSGINRLINVISSSTKNSNFWPLLIVSIIMIFLGIYSIVVGDIILSTIGLIMMIFAAIDIIGYIFYVKDTSAQEKEGATTLIIAKDSDRENEEKKEKNIKDVKNIEEKKEKKKKKKKDE